MTACSASTSRFARRDDAREQGGDPSADQRVVPWSPVIAMILVPVAAGGDKRRPSMVHPALRAQLATYVRALKDA
jgi:hypothetical protein